MNCPVAEGSKAGEPERAGVDRVEEVVSDHSLRRRSVRGPSKLGENRVRGRGGIEVSAHLCEDLAVLSSPFSLLTCSVGESW